LVFGPQITQKWCRLISSMMKFAEQRKVHPGLKISKFWLCSYLLNTKMRKKSAINFVLWWNLLNKTGQHSFLPYFSFNPKAKLRFEVTFKKFRPRMNLATLFSTKTYLLHTIKPFSGHENRYLTRSQKSLQGGYL
jgi:hypothetical protein